MTIERPEHRTGNRRVLRPVGPAGFDLRELELAEAIRRHVLLRDACLAPAALMPVKLEALDRHRWSSPSDSAETGRRDDGGRIGVVAQMAGIRRTVRDTGALLACERRRLVLLDVLASLPVSPDPAIPWSRSPIDLVGEAATGIGYAVSDIRRLAHRLAVARGALPSVEAGSSTTRSLAEALRRVEGVTPGAAAAHAAFLLSDQVPANWLPSSCGASLLDPAPFGPRSMGSVCRFAGTVVARHDLSAFVEDLATLRVAADISPTLRRYATVMLPDLAAELNRSPVGDPDLLDMAADLSVRTTHLIARGFRRFDRAPRGHRFQLLA